MLKQTVTRQLPALLFGLALSAGFASAQTQSADQQSNSTATAEPIKVSATTETQSGKTDTSRTPVQGAVGEVAKSRSGSLSQPNMKATGRGPHGTTFENLDTNYSN